jgi:hypothetical protein
MTVINPPPGLVESQRRFFAQHPDATFCDWMDSLDLDVPIVKFSDIEYEECEQCGKAFKTIGEILKYNGEQWLCPDCAGRSGT